MDPSVRREIQARAVIDPPPPVEVAHRDRPGLAFLGGAGGLLAGGAACLLLRVNSLAVFGGWLAGSVGPAFLPSVQPGWRYCVGAVAGGVAAVVGVVLFVFAMFATGMWKMGGW